MDELELVRLHEDGERLVLVARDGAQSTLPITDALRAAIRGDRPRMESIRAQAESALRPREIQARLRAGETPEQLAEASGLPVEHVRRFEYPVISEREHSVSRVRAKAVLTDGDGATTLGEVADERLRSRGVRPDDATWTATREGTHPWIVRVEFTAADRPRVARWSLEPRGGFVEALDDEARWLGLPEDMPGPTLAGVSALPPHRAGHPSARPAPPEPDDTDLLLDNLSERRGQRPARRPTPEPDLPGLDLDDADGASAPAGVGPPGGAEGSATAASGTGVSGTESSGTAASGAGPDDRDAGRDAQGAEAAEPSAAVVDLRARRGGSRPAMPSVTVPDSPADLEWEGPSQWEIPGPGSRKQGAGSPAAGSRDAGSRGTGSPGAGSSGAGGSDAARRAPAEGPAPSAESDPAHDRPAEQPPTDQPPTDQSPPKRPAGRRGRKSRAQVPSWDEIVFGSRPEV